MVYIDKLSFCVCTCVNESLPRCIERVSERVSRLSSSWPSEIAPLQFERIYFPQPQRGGAEPANFVVWEPTNRPHTSVFYVNSPDGWSRLIQGMSKDGMPSAVSIRSYREDMLWNLQEIHCRAVGNITKRLLRLSEDEDGHEFIEKGEPLAFEDFSIPAEQRISSRARLIEFVRDFDIDLASDDFWSSKGPATYFFEKRQRNAVP